MPSLLFESDSSVFPERTRLFPQLRYMGSKARLLRWMHTVLSKIEFGSALDGFAGSGCVSYLLKCMGKRVTSNDFLQFSATIARSTIENSSVLLDPQDIATICRHDPRRQRFIEKTFDGIFFTTEDLRFLDRACWNIRTLECEYKRAIALAALVRSCIKRQPRGVFTVAGDPARYKDGRRDIRLTLREHFHEQVEVYNRCVFDNGQLNKSVCGDVLDASALGIDLVYLDPPYVPRADDNCYMKRYHFLEGVATYWENVEILQTSRVKKIKKPYTPFSYRKTAEAAFTQMFERFQSSTIVLSYSSNGFPNLERLVELMRRCKPKVSVHERPHRYHFGTHRSAARNSVMEYLIVGTA